MWEKIVNLAISNGLFAVLFLGLLIYCLKDSSKREKKYQETILFLNKNLNSALEVKEDIEEVKVDIKQINKNLDKPRTKKVKNTNL